MPAAGVAALLLAGSLSACAAGATPPAAAEASGAGFSAGLQVRPDADVAAVGLPVYPGAQRWKEPGEDGPGVSVSLWGGSAGMQLQVLKLRSQDPLDTVAAWYRRQLQSQPGFQDCSQAPAQVRRPASSAGVTIEMGCEPGDRPREAGGGRGADARRVYTVGVRRDQRMVSIRAAEGGGVRIEMVHLLLRGLDD